MTVDPKLAAEDLQELAVESIETVQSVWLDFRQWLRSSQAIDLGFGIIIGSMFNQILTSLMTDILVPPVGYLLDHRLTNLFYVLKEGPKGRPYSTLDEALHDGAITENYGRFLQNCLTFGMVCVVLYVLVRLSESFKRRLDLELQGHHEQMLISPKQQLAVDLKQFVNCPACDCPISKRAVRCPHCTTFLQQQENPN